MPVPFRLPLRTERLILRRLERTDAQIVRRLAGDWELARWTSDIPHPYDLAMAREFIVWAQGQFAGGRRFVFAIVSRNSGELVGVISLTLLGRIEGELGYWIGRPFQKQGLASEAAARIVQLAFEDLDLQRVTAACLPDNEPSWRVMERCGLSYVERIQRWAPARHSSIELLLYAMKRPALAESLKG